MLSPLFSPFEYCLELHRKNRLPHAMIFSGGENILMEKAGVSLANFLLCEKPKTHTSCGICHNCQLFQAESHPDFLKLVGEGKSHTIKIDAIRDLTEFLHQTASMGKYRVVLVLNAQDLNTAGSNAFLKSLEEPGENTLIILTASDEHLLLPTLRSRSQIIHFETPVFEIALPALVQELKPEFNPLVLAQNFHTDPLALLETLQSVMQEKIKETLGLTIKTNPSVDLIDLEKALDFCELCLARKKNLISKIPLNPVLFAEDLLIAFSQV